MAVKSIGISPWAWFYREFGLGSIHETGRNGYIIILARSLRMFGYGTGSLIMAIFFSALKYSDHQIGLFMTLTLLGDVLLGTALTLVADRMGRRNVLLVGSLLMIASGIIFSLFENFWLLLFAAIVGVISVTGGDFGPFRSVEESILSELTTASTRADVLSWYVTASTLGSSIGSEASGRMIHYLLSRDGWTEVQAYHAMFWMYPLMGVVNAILVLCLTDACEMQKPAETYVELAQNEDDSDDTGSQNEVPDIEAMAPARHCGSRIWRWFSSRFTQISAPTRSIMYKLWFLLAVDCLADGMVPYTLTNYYMDLKFHPKKSTLGDVTSIAYFLGSICAVFAGPLARKIGLVNTMVFTHVPSSAAVLIFPLPSAFWMTAGLLFVRAGLNNMDQAPRSAFIAAVVKPEERTAVMGITGMLRTLAAMCGPTVTGFLASSNQFWIAFVVAGICRLAYDFGLYALFINTKLHENETKAPQMASGGTAEVHLDEEAEELQSLADSDSAERSNGKLGAQEVLAKSGLQLPSSGERVRSRSRHRSRERKA